MCRTGGRRCPCRQDDRRRSIEVARQRLSRYARRADAASDPDDQARNERLFESALTDVEDRTGHRLAPVPEPPATRAGEFTPEATASWSDEQLEAALADCWNDQQAVDAIAAVMDAREQTSGAATADPLPDRAEQAWADWDSQPNDPIERPGLRPSRRLTAEQQARADYETMREVWFLQAEYECNGQLVSARYRDQRIDPRSLWTGPATRAMKYASPELASWWARNGRTTWTAFRYHALGRRSDKAQAESVRLGTAFDDAIR